MHISDIPFVRIETPRLLLKGLSTELVNQVFGTFPKEEIKIILGHRSEEEYLKEEYKYLNGYASYNRRFLMFLLTDKTSGLMIGRCGLHNWNPEHKRAEIGYVMQEESYKQKGLMSEAVQAILDYGFGSMDLNRIEAMTGSDNMASIRILEKNGFIREGLMRKHYFTPEGYLDSVLFAKLQNEHRNG